MSSNSLTAAQGETIERLAHAYADGEPGAATALVDAMDESLVPLVSHEIRAALMDAIMSGKKKSLDDRSSKLLRAALFATTDASYLATRGQTYLECGEQMAAETLLEWRVVLAARKQRGSNAHVEAILDLAEVYVAGAKLSDARELRDGAANALESRAAQDRSAAGMMTRVAQCCFDVADYSQAETIASRALKLLETALRSDSGNKQLQGDLIDCLRLRHAFAQRQNRHNDARAIAQRIQAILGGKAAIDEIERLLTTYVRLPEFFDLRLHPEGIRLTTDDFPRIVHECSGLDLQKYFLDAWSQSPALTPDQRVKIAKDLFHVLRTVSEFNTGPEGAHLVRSEETVIDLPSAMSNGFVQTITFGRNVTFRLVPNPPDEATFVNVSGITFGVGGKLVGMSELSLRAEGNNCVITPLLGECGQIKQAASNTFDLLKNTGKDFLVGFFLKTKTFSTTLPIIQDEYRGYLADAINLKRSLQYKEKDLLSFFERCARIEVDDPLTRALLEGGSRVCKKVEDICIERRASTDCDMGGVELKFAPSVGLKMLKKTSELAIPAVDGVDVRVAFDAPSELKVIGLDLRRSLPTRIESLTLSPPGEETLRRIVVGTAPGKWIGLDLDEKMRPAFDKNGNWMVFGVTSNPISGASQSFFLRLDGNNELKMTTREIAALVNQTAMEGFDPADPTTWQWGAVAIGAQTLLTAGAVLRSTIGDEETDKIAEEVQEVAKFIKKLFF